MQTKVWVMTFILVGFLGSVSLGSSHAREGQDPSTGAVKSIGLALAKAYTFEPVHPNPPDHRGLTKAMAGFCS